MISKASRHRPASNVGLSYSSNLAKGDMIPKLLAAAGLIVAVAYGIAMVGIAATQGSRNTDSYIALCLVTSPLVVVSAAGWLWARRGAARGGLLLTAGGLLMAGWGLFVAVDIGPGWFLSGLAVFAGGLALLCRRPRPLRADVK